MQAALSLRFNGHSPGERVSRCLQKQRMMEVVATTGLLEPQAVQSSSQTITTNKPTSIFLQGGCPSCRPTDSVKALKGKYHIPWTCLPQAHLGVFQLCLWPLTAPGYLGEGFHASHQSSDASTPVQCNKAKLPEPSSMGFTCIGP